MISSFAFWVNTFVKLSLVSKDSVWLATSWPVFLTFSNSWTSVFVVSSLTTLWVATSLIFFSVYVSIVWNSLFSLYASSVCTAVSLAAYFTIVTGSSISCRSVYIAISMHVLSTFPEWAKSNGSVSTNAVYVSMSKPAGFRSVCVSAPWITTRTVWVSVLPRTGWIVWVAIAPDAWATVWVSFATTCAEAWTSASVRDAIGAVYDEVSFSVLMGV